jgi:hypothetical protein
MYSKPYNALHNCINQKDRDELFLEEYFPEDCYQPSYHYKLSTQEDLDNISNYPDYRMNLGDDWWTFNMYCNLVKLIDNYQIFDLNTLTRAQINDFENKITDAAMRGKRWLIDHDLAIVTATYEKLNPVLDELSKLQNNKIL